MIPTRLRPVFIAIALVVSSIAFSNATKTRAILNNSPKAVVDEAWQLVQREYVDRSFNNNDWVEVRKEYLDRSYTSQTQAYVAINEMVGRLEDKYTRFLSPQALKELVSNVSGEFIGVGITVTLDPKTREWVVIKPFQESPAETAGILPKDVIISLNGTNTADIRLDQAAPYLIGPVGSKLKIQVRRQAETLTYELVREQINLNPLSYQAQDSPQGKIGYIRFPVFTTKSPGAMKNAILQLEKQGVEGYILDLRGNPGGVLDSGIEIAKMWIDHGKIMTLKTGQGKVETYEGNQTALTPKPLQVLVDGSSASASEVLAGALQENQRGHVLGSQTFGKGVVQSLEQLGDGAGLVITVAQYFTPEGKDIHKKGIKPNELVQNSVSPAEDVSKHNFSQDSVYQKAKSNLLETSKSLDIQK